MCVCVYVVYVCMYIYIYMCLCASPLSTIMKFSSLGFEAVGHRGHFGVLVITLNPKPYSGGVEICS